MAKKDTDRPQMTDDLDLGPGLVVTPGYEVAPRPSADGPLFSDRPLTVRTDAAAVAREAAQHTEQIVADVPTLSTYAGPVSGVDVTPAVPAEVQPAPAPTEPQA